MARQLLKEGATFEVRESDLDLEIPIDPEARYTLQPITTDYARGAYKRFTTQRPNRRTHTMEDVVDTVAVSNALLDYCIVGWSGIVEDGTAAPCDLAHKLQLPTVVQAALVERAQIGGSAERRAASFREPASVV
jgi:hypothetical protein